MHLNPSAAWCITLILHWLTPGSFFLKSKCEKGGGGIVVSQKYRLLKISSYPLRAAVAFNPQPYALVDVCTVTVINQLH